MISASSVRAITLSTTLFVRARRIIWPTSVPAPVEKKQKTSGTGVTRLFGGCFQGKGHASGCFRLRAASASQPLGPRWPATHASVSTQARTVEIALLLRQRTLGRE